MVFYAMCCWHYDVTSVFLNVRRREEQKPLEWWVQQEWNPLAQKTFTYVARPRKVGGGQMPDVGNG